MPTQPKKPAKQRLLGIFKDFKGGWVTDKAPDTLEDNELEVLDNIETRVVGALPKRRGSAPLSANLGAQVSKVIEWNRKDGSTQYLGVVGNDLVEFDSDWVPGIIQSLDAPDIGHFFFQDKFYFTGKTSSTDKFWQYGGGTKQVETATVIGTITLAGNATVVVTAAGMTGSPKTLSVAVALDDTAQLVAGKIRTALQADTAVMALFSVGGTGADITLTRRIEAADDATLNISIDNGTCTGLTTAATSTDTTAGVAGLAEVTPDGSADNDLAPIKRCRRFVFNPRNFRIYAALDPEDQSCLYYSEANDPDYFKNTSKLYPTSGEGAIITITAFAGGVVIHFKNSLWAFTGVAIDSDATWGKIPVAHGTIATNSVCDVPNSLAMVGIGGIYALSMSALDKDMSLLQGDKVSTNLTQNKVSSTIRSIVHPESMCCMYQEAKSRLLLAYGDDSLDSNNNRVLVLDWELGAFARFTGWRVDCFCPCINGNIYAGSGNYVLQLDTGLNDWDVEAEEYVPVEVEVWSKQWDFGSPYHIKKVRRTFLSAYQFDNTDTTISQMGLKSGYHSVSFNDVLLDESFVWGEDWGRVWGWTDIITKEFKTRLKGVRVQWRFTHSELDEDLLIYGVAFEYKLKKAKGVKYSGSPDKDLLS